MTEITPRYIAPTRPDRAFNAVVGWLTRHGVSLAGSRVLAVRGRSTGEWRTTVVNLLVVDGSRYLVAPRGETQWVRNVRAAGRAELRIGRRVEEVVATELADSDKVPVLRAYLARWGWEVGRFFEGLRADAPDVEVVALEAGFPVFRLEAVPGSGERP